MATFGKTTAGASTTLHNANRKVLSQAVLTEPATLTSMTIRAKLSAAGTRNWTPVIYADNGGVAGNLLVTGNAGTITSTTVSSLTATFNSNTLVAGTYWIGYIHSGDATISVTISRDNTTNGAVSNTDTYSDGPANPAGTLASLGGPIDAYVTYTPIGATGLHVVQAASKSDGSGTSTSVSITLAQTPTVGNLLIYFGSFDYNKTYAGTTSGWTAIGPAPYTNARAAMSAMYRIVQSGDTASWTFPQIGTADTESGTLVEVTGQATASFINGYIESGSSTSVTSNTSGSVTPTVTGTLAIGFFAEDTGAGGTVSTDNATITTGWNFDQRAYSDYHSSWLAHRTSLTTDTTTAINATVSGTSSSANSSIIVLIAPPAPTGGTIVQSNTGNTSTNYVNSSTVSLASSVTAGNTLVLAVGSSGIANDITSVTDTQSRTWTKLSSVYNNRSADIWYVANASAGSTTVTINSTNYTEKSFVLYELSGLATGSPVDVSGSASDGTSYLNSHAATLTTTNTDLIIGAYSGSVGTDTYTGTNVISAGGDTTNMATSVILTSSAGSNTVTIGSSGYEQGILLAAAFKINTGPTAPTASFTATPKNIIVGSSVTFTDTSSGTPTSWSWTFGDTGTSTSQNPTHTYLTAGTYTVALTATNGLGNNTSTRTNLITVYAAAPGASSQSNWYTYGYPAVTNYTTRTTYLQNAWNVFKNYTFTQTGMPVGMPAGAWRVQVPDQTDVNGHANFTNSEGIGYGMLAAVYMGMASNPVYDSTAKSYFDGFWTYYNYFKDTNGLMNWRVDNTGTVIGTGGATDGDLDVAFALIMAHRVWGSAGTINYQTQAQNLINAIKAYEFYPSTATGGKAYMMMNGDQWDSGQTGSPDWIMPDYYAPAYMSEFATFMSDSWWTTAKSVNQAIMVDTWAQNYNDGFVPDNATREGGAVSGQGFTYGFNAIRRFRLVLDYLWNGGSSTPFTYYLNKNMADFIGTTSSGSATATNAAWALDGSTNGGYSNIAFNQSYAAATLVSSSNSSFGSTLYSYIDTNNTSANASSTGYFGTGLALMSALVGSGLMTNTYTPPATPTNLFFFAS